jgi:predicted ATPase
MLTTIKLRNFKCFEKHTIPLRTTTIIVGQNNSGKSTIVEALRLVSIIANRYAHLPYGSVPRWLDVPKAYRGVSPALDNQDINFDCVFHRYASPPAEIEARFESGAVMTVYIGGPDKVHAVVFDPDKKIVTTQQQAAALRLPRIGILPQISPVNPSERVLQAHYVRKAIDSNLASWHFRNQLNLLYAVAFDEFTRISESTWPRLKIQELRGQGLVRNEDFVAEVAWMGHGLQMWLQTMWFLARSPDSSTLILDEPDVYMHADLQRKLIRFLRRKGKQVIIATHSIEIMAEVDPENILVVDRGKRQAKFATDIPTVQKAVDHIGGVHNLQLARLWNAKRCLFVEGNDVLLFKIFQDKLFPDSEEPLDVIPNLSVNGWAGWNYVVGSSMLMESNFGAQITTYCVLDSDYHTDDQKERRLQEAKERQINLHIWKKKEIENYLLLPNVISRLIGKKGSSAAPSEAAVWKKTIQIANKFKDEIIDNYAEEIIATQRRGTKNAYQSARTLVATKWKTNGGILSLVPGKRMLAKLSLWSQDNFQVAFSSFQIAQELRRSEIDPEVVAVIRSIEDHAPFEE